MKNNKGHGFTLVELLAVIVILAVILIIAMPKISEVIKKTRLSSLEATAKLLINQAEKKYTENQVLDNSSAIKCSDVAKLNDTDYGTCKITFDDKGNASVILNGKKDGKFDNLSCTGTKEKINCSEGEAKVYRKCTTSDTLVKNLKFIDGQYTYTYNGSTGWGVVLTDKKATTPVTTELCGTINDKPIVDMNRMFQNSQATSIDVSSFNTSNVTNMWSMFAGSQATSLDLSSFDTSKVTGMGDMFNESQATSLDLSSFNTSKVTNMISMFYESQATTIKGLENFDTSNVNAMLEMFYGSQATSLDLSSFDTSNVINMRSMFEGSNATEIKGLENFDTSNVSDMSVMFSNSRATSLDLSSFNTSNVYDMSGMFWESQATSLDLSSFNTSNVEKMDKMFELSRATTGYAKTCEDAARFNASSNKPSWLTFTVKDTTC